VALATLATNGDDPPNPDYWTSPWQTPAGGLTRSRRDARERREKADGSSAGVPASAA